MTAAVPAGLTDRSLLAIVEERFLVPAYASPRAAAWITTHAALALPFQLRGAVRRSEMRTAMGTLRVVEIGREKLLAPFRDQLLESRSEPRGEGTLSLCKPAALETLEADLTMVEIHRWMAPRFRRAGWIVIPHDVRWMGDLSAIPAVASRNTSLKSDLAKVRRYGYTLEQAFASGDWEEFYTGMVVPQATARFGNGAWIPSERLRRELAQRGSLHFVRRDGVRVAGVCSVRTGDSLWVPLMGLRQGHPALLKEGAYAAVFALLFAWAHKQGCTRVDAGRTSAFVQDGIQRFKRKWGLAPVADPLTHLIAIRVGAAARPLFARQPVLVETAHGIETYPEVV